MATKNSLLSQGNNTQTGFNQIPLIIEAHQASHQTPIMHMGIGNTTQPFGPTVIKALHDATSKLGRSQTYTGYGDPQGNIELRKAISKNWYQSTGINMDPSEIFVSDGAQSDSTNIQELFSINDTVALQNPAYPSFIEGNLLAGREKINFLPCYEEKNFIPDLPQQPVDIIYLCYPNNPTGAVATKPQLQKYVDFANQHGSVIIFDAVYSGFITDPKIPKTIYEVPNAQKCAIEINSFSKFAGFTGLRLGWTVIPQELTIKGTSEGELNHLWKIRQSTKFWGASNVAQKAGIAALSKQGQKECKKNIGYYLENARFLKESLESTGLKCFGGIHNPFLWVKTPGKMSSWEFFERLLYEANIAGTPGCLFGSMGEGYLRLSCLGHREEIENAVQNINGKLTFSCTDTRMFVA